MHKAVRSRPPPNRPWPHSHSAAELDMLTLSRDGCGRCDGHHKIVDCVQSPLSKANTTAASGGYIAVTILTTPLLQAFGINQSLTVSHNRDILKSDFVAWGVPPTRNQRVNMRKASSMFACRQGRCRRHLRLGRAALISRGRAAGIYYFPARGTSGQLNAQLPLPIPSSAASACERAFSREALLPLTRDTVLAACRG